ncbi:hypothetical protein B9N43_12495 [Denitratisoma sp. DHT3]|uniref:SPOR domain-containing protein n=1 Tax=Denitratisoma sp. DHT3 TaxID=1981880 RepID=UPI0011988F0C|nr:SPOR domain-containing protein [Denitratisoma sp. DHT3]QDX81995.1 hypothetical protein B9N43_12495 [Denitratisoma sp. DHT3]
MVLLRLAVLLAVFANLVFYAWNRNAPGDTGDGREPRRLAAQVAPEKLRLVPAAELKALEAPSIPSVAPVTANGSREACRLVTGLKAADGERLRAAWQARLPELHFKRLPIDTAPMYQIAIDGLPGRAAAEAKLAEVRALGIKSEVSYVNPAPSRYALVFATFRSEAGAREYLADLAHRGVKSARIVTHPSSPQESRIEARGPEAGLARLAELLKPLTGAKLEECATP